MPGTHRLVRRALFASPVQEPREVVDIISPLPNADANTKSVSSTAKNAHRRLFASPSKPEQEADAPINENISPNSPSKPGKRLRDEAGHNEFASWPTAKIHKVLSSSPERETKMDPLPKLDLTHTSLSNPTDEIELKSAVPQVIQTEDDNNPVALPRDFQHFGLGLSALYDEGEFIPQTTPANQHTMLSDDSEFLAPSENFLHFGLKLDELYKDGELIYPSMPTNPQTLQAEAIEFLQNYQPFDLNGSYENSFANDTAPASPQSAQSLDIQQETQSSEPTIAPAQPEQATQSNSSPLQSITNTPAGTVRDSTEEEQNSSAMNISTTITYLPIDPSDTHIWEQNIAEDDRYRNYIRHTNQPDTAVEPQQPEDEHEELSISEIEENVENLHPKASNLANPRGINNYNKFHQHLAAPKPIDSDLANACARSGSRMRKCFR